MALLVAVLGRRAGIGLGSHDVYANLAGGLELDDPGLDLPLCLALASSLRDKPVPRDLVAIGEVGLLGELRPVPGLERRLREAARLGFRTAIVPVSRRGDVPMVAGMEVIAVANLRTAIGHAVGAASGAGRPSRQTARRVGRRRPTGRPVRPPARPAAATAIAAGRPAAMAAPGLALGRTARAARRGVPVQDIARGPWHGATRDARLTRRSAALHSSFRHSSPFIRFVARLGIVIRIIRLLGAAIGALIGLGFVLAEERSFEKTGSPGLLIPIWVAAWISVGFLLLPYLTVVPAGRLIRGVQAMSTAEFVAAVAGLLIGLLIALLLGLPLSACRSRTATTCRSASRSASAWACSA